MHHGPSFSVITGGDSLVSHTGWGAGGGDRPAQWAGGGSWWPGCAPWRRPFAVHDLGKIVLDLADPLALAASDSFHYG
ncbi:MAG: hypothetical protein ACRDUW_12535 [Pseudonocardiaceae bacterium]